MYRAKLTAHNLFMAVKNVKTRRCHYAKDVKFGTDIRFLMLQGVDILADAVAVTMGPMGRSVIVEQRFGPPKITKDGFTVAKSIELQDKFQNIGTKIVQDVAKKTNEEAGDGTTTAIVLARAIAREGFNHISIDANPIEIRKGIILAVNYAIEKLGKISKSISTIEEIKQVATISANGDKAIGNLIAKAMAEVGKDGVIIIKMGKTFEDSLEVTEGIKFNRGYISPYFINSTQGTKVEYNDAFILFSEKKIFTVQQILPALEIAQEKKKPLVIVTEDIEDEPLSTLIVNKLKAGLPVVAVKAPSFAEHRQQILMDMAIATGGVVFEDNTNLIRLEDCQPESLGKVGEVIITKDSTTFIKGKGDKEEIEERNQSIRKEIEKASANYKKLQLIDRLSRLESRVAVLYIGGSSEVEINDKRDKIDDALNATRAAIAEGIVPGGGAAFLRCIPFLEKINAINNDQVNGVNIVKNALQIPCATIAMNAGVNGNIVVSNLLDISDENYGYNVLNNSYVDMIENGIIDSTKVVKRALIDASRIASLLATAEVAICDTSKQKKTLVCT